MERCVEDINYYSFNQTKEYFFHGSRPLLTTWNSYLAVGTNDGFRIFGVDPFELRYSYGSLTSF